MNKGNSAFCVCMQRLSWFGQCHKRLWKKVFCYQTTSSYSAFLFSPRRHHYRKRVIINYGRIGVHISKVIYAKLQIGAASKDAKGSNKILND